MARKINSELREIEIKGSEYITESIFPGNKLQLSRYTLLSFFPKNLFEQFQRISNIWFLIVSVFQLIPLELNPTESWNTIVPLACLISISLLKDAYNEYFLHKKLKVLNNSKFLCWDGGKFISIKAQDILVGHFIQVNENQVVPADMIIVASQTTGRFFLDMTSLEGVPSLIEKSDVNKLSKLINSIESGASGLSNLKGKFKVSEPNSDYSNFRASVKLENRPSAIEVGISNLLFSGGVLKGSGPVIGFVVYCGVESKMQLNTDPFRRKFSRLEETVNTWVLYLLAILAIFVIGSVFGYYYSNTSSLNNDQTLSTIITFTLLYNNIIPISLFMVIDIIRILQNFFFTYYNKGVSFNTDIVNENIGQLDYIIVDKTGTLSEKKLTIKACIIGNKKYENIIEDSADLKSYDPSTVPLNSTPRNPSQTADSFNSLKCSMCEENNNSPGQNFFKCMALCHNLYENDGKYFGDAEEVAMVETASYFGYNLVSISQRYYELEYNQITTIYKLISNREFNKNKKKSRILLEESIGGGGLLYIKGSTQDVISLMNITPAQDTEIRNTFVEYETKGYKCIAFGYKRISQKDMQEYQSEIKMIKKSLIKNDRRTESFFKKIENNMKYLGIALISEEVFPDVNKTVNRLQRGGIKLWMVSSDSARRSLSIATECGIIDPDITSIELLNLTNEISCNKALTKVINSLIFDKVDAKVIRPSYSNYNDRKNSHASKPYDLRSKSGENIEDDEKSMIEDNVHKPRNNIRILRKLTKVDFSLEDTTKRPFDPCNIHYSVIIDRKTWKLALQDDDCRKLLVIVLVCAKSVCFSGLMPRDKGNVVKLLKESVSFKPLVSAIGSGEGDINMLQLSDVGIAIKNEESLAMNYSDLVIDKFTMLDKLILMQGHYNYTRLSKTIFLFLYKNFFLTIVLFAYTFICSYSGTSIFNASLLVGYNLFFTTVPIIVIGIFDEDLPGDKIIKQPQVYGLGIKNTVLNTKNFFRYMIIAGLQGLVLSLLSYLCLPYMITSGGDGEDMEMLGTYTYITLIVVVLIQIYVETCSYNILYYLSMVISIVCLVIFIVIESHTNFPNTDLYGIGSALSKSSFSLIFMSFSPLICIIPIYFIYFYLEIASVGIIAKVKSNHSLIQYNTNKLEFYQNSLSSLYKNSGVWKCKLQEQKFSINKRLLKFKLPYIEKNYTENFIKEHTRLYQSTLGFLWALVLIWLIFDLTISNSSLEIILSRIVVLVVCSIFLIFLWTVHFQKNYISYMTIAILAGLLSKFGLEAGFENTSVLTTSLISSVTFLILNVHWVYICLLNILNVILFIISLSIDYGINISGNAAGFLIASDFVLTLAISLTSCIAGYYCELSRRTEYKLINKSKYRIEQTYSILKILLPPFVRNRVKEGIRYIAESQGDVTIVFCDICDFEKITEDYNPTEFTDFLDKLFSNFDYLCEGIGVTKIETVGKTYMACAGLKDGDKEMPFYLRSQNHGHRAVELAFAMIQEVKQIQLKNGNFLQVKIGVNSGPVSAGVVGYHKPQFSLVGDTVNTASRMCSTIDAPNSIQISSSTYGLIKEYTQYEFSPKSVEAKGKGIVTVYLINEKKNNSYDIAAGISSTLFDATSHVSGSMKSDGSLNLERNQRSARHEPMASKKWRESMLLKKDMDLIDYKPYFNLFLKLAPNEIEFRSKRREKNYYSMYLSIVIALFTYILLLVLSIFSYFYTDLYSNNSIIIARGLFVAFLIIPVVFYKRIYKKIYYNILILICLGIMMLVIILELTYKNRLPKDSIGLEILYIIVLLLHASENSLGVIIIWNSILLIVWIILSIFSSDVTKNLINALLAAAFSFINIKAIYSQEIHDRTNYNLNKCAAKEFAENEALLKQMIPPHVLEYLEQDKSFTDRIMSVSLIFADIVGFTALSSHKSPNEIVEMLSNLFTRFDKLCVEFDVYKVHTIGDCYVVMGHNGKRERNPSLECLNVMKMAHKMIEVIKEENIKHSSELNMRIGIHTGQVIAGVIGTSLVRYDIWGRDVLIANKMESNGEAGRVKVSIDTKEMIESRVTSGITFEESNQVNITSLGVSKKTYFVNCPDINLIESND
jgi:phospholipid-translocating P-type ATPase (flippase)